ncbi:MAG: prepilin peptidase [Candidatus Omnitrophica bacterium CG11_big_fil_rev_8_21_14_0_20_42_13]|uniref:Prepilin leader peptidase/N-methyltransferase n=1 Tax=Candidatus Ghiorseimicrobium undicola TaxID=1974746 RepID=A0A2H0LWK4_9BACT|nr:MAG: prepilin peptidase [Candidatus Omnitrophica bacterium CG11_big_fil_rev_8_21_14_0_20_42_13]
MSIFIFIFGSIVGSFLNVCIYRMPKAESIVMPGSRCPCCNNKIQWYDNIPLVSYILLRARCRYCNMSIPARYFIVELITASVFLGLFRYYGLTADFFIYALFFSLLLIASFVDIKYRIIPDEVSLGGLALGLILSFIFPEMQDGVVSRIEGIFYSFIGALSASLLTYLIGLIGTLLFRKDAMGFGDVKLMAAIGAFLGWKLAIVAFFIAPFFGAIFGIIVLIQKKGHLIPYGPFLSLGAVLSLFYGNAIIKLLFYGY